MTRVALTGAGGFIGGMLVPWLSAAGLEIVPVYRKGAKQTGFQLEICSSTDWSDVVESIDVVVHLAGLAHSTSETQARKRYREINVDATRNLAEQAAKSGVARFVFLSSIKVNGEQTTVSSFHPFDSPNPHDIYSQSKLEAEMVLRDIEQATGMEVVIIRPPLIYGPGVKGNLAVLQKMVQKGVPIPTGSIKNQRDLLSIYNLCDLIRVCIEHPAAAGKLFLACDGQSLSTNEIIRQFAKGLSRSARIIDVPERVLRFFAAVLGKTDSFEKIRSDLSIDMSETQRLLEWEPPLTVGESFTRMFSDAVS